MIKTLRHSHFYLIAFLAVMLVIVFVAGITARKPAPLNPSIPNSLLKSPGGDQR